MVGGDYIEKNLKCLALEGRLVMIAFLHGGRVEVDWRHIMMKRLTVTGSTLRASPAERKFALAKSLREKVWPMLESGKVKPVIHRVYPAGRSGGRARADGVLAAHRQDHAGGALGRRADGAGARVRSGGTGVASRRAPEYEAEPPRLCPVLPSTSRARPTRRTPRPSRTSSPRSRATPPAPRSPRRRRSVPSGSSTA